MMVLGPAYKAATLLIFLSNRIRMSRFPIHCRFLLLRIHRPFLWLLLLFYTSSKKSRLSWSGDRPLSLSRFRSSFGHRSRVTDSRTTRHLKFWNTFCLHRSFGWPIILRSRSDYFCPVIVQGFFGFLVARFSFHSFPFVSGISSSSLERLWRFLRIRNNVLLWPTKWPIES